MPALSAGLPAVLLVAGAGSSLDHAVWFAARSTGLAAYALATASVVFGVATATRAGDRVAGRGVITDVHRALSLLTVLVIAGHVMFLALDTFTSFGPLDLLVPFVNWYRPIWTGLGIFAAYLAFVVFASFYLRSLLGYRAWRTLHYTSFAVFALATLHGLFSGSDSGEVWAKAFYASSLGLVAVAIAYRLLRGTSPRPEWPLPVEGRIGFRLTSALGVAVLAVMAPVGVLMLVHTSSASTTADTSASLADGGLQMDGVGFAGSQDSSGTWHLSASGPRPLNLDITQDGTATLRDTTTGEVLYKTGVIQAASAGSLRIAMEGQGSESGRSLQFDGTYRRQGSELQVVANLSSVGSG